MTADYHLHSCFSGDSETPTEEMIKKGLAPGAFSYVYDRPPGYGLPLFRCKL